MERAMQKAIEFINPWRGRVPGEINTELDYGVMAELVRTHKAKWHTPEATKSKGSSRKKRGQS